MVHSDTNDPVVISGIGGRYPESRSVDEFWSNLLSGKELCSADDRRWPVGHLTLPPKAGKIPDIEKFDGSFFGMDDKSCNETDPQIKIALETTFEAVIDAGLDPVELSGYRTGVFTGYCYSDATSAKNLDAGSYSSDWTEEQSIVSTTFGFKGSNMTYDSACASTFSAYNEAVKCVQSGILDTAILMGTAICAMPFTASAFRQLGMTSATGECRCMDNNALGYVRSETVGTIVLQKKSVAKRIYAVVLNTISNSDGYKPEGITFPGQESMVRLMRQAYQEIGLDPKDTKYIEGHVTGTQAGDPVECNAIERVFCPDDRTDPIMVGCLKSNMGHAEGASGAAAITKACLILQRGLIPPNILFEEPNSNIAGLKNGKLKPVLNVEQFNGGIISLNSFGFGGSNIHTIFHSFDEYSNGDIDNITGFYGVNRLVLFKSRSRQGFEKLIRKIQFSPKEITTEFLDLLNNVSNLNKKWILPVRGFVILDPKKRIIASDFEIKSDNLDSSQTVMVQYKSDPFPSWATNHINLLKKIGLKIKMIAIKSKSNGITLKYDTMNGRIELPIEKSTGSNAVLGFIGKIYISGHNGIELKKMYPCIKYPVSKRTASISPLIEWNHDQDWLVYKVPDYFHLPIQKSFSFDYAGFEHYLSGHKIDGRILFPAAGYLFAIWQSLAIEVIGMSWTAYLQTGIKFWNVKLMRAIVVNRGEEIVITTRINRDTGAFEIGHKQSCIVSGYAELTYDDDCPMKNKGLTNDEEKEMISAKDFYKELRVRGYDYEDDFKGVTACNVDGTGGTITFLRNWICFIDAVFQLTLINDRSRQLFVPTGFEFLQVDAKVIEPISTKEVDMYKNIQQSSAIERNDMEKEKEKEEGNENSGKEKEEEDENYPKFNVKIVKETMEIFANGTYVKGMKAMPIPRKKAIPVVRSQYFLPFNQKIDEENSKEKTEYSFKCLNILNGETIEKKVTDEKNNETNVPNENMALLNFLEGGKSLLELKSIDMSNDILTKIPFDERTIFHQLGIVSEGFIMKELKVTEINLSTKSNIQESIEILLGELYVTGISYSSYNKIRQAEAENEKQKNSIEAYLVMNRIDSELVIIQHHSLGFAFLNTEDKTREQKEKFTEVLESSFDKINNGHFVMVIARTKANIVEEKLLEENCCLQMDSIEFLLSEIKKSKFTVVSVKQIGSYVSILGKKVDQTEINDISEENLIEIDSFNYEWVDKLKETVFDKELDENGNQIGAKPNQVKSIWIKNSSDITGLSGFLNCIRHEDKRFHGVTIMDENCNRGSVMEEAFQLNLNSIAYKNGALGSIANSKYITSDSDQNELILNTFDSDTVSYCLDVESKGDLSSLRYYQTAISNGPGVVKVHFSALNFKDVMVASGRVPVTAYPEAWILTNSGNLGMEFSGINFKGERVMGICPTDSIATKLDVGSGSKWLFQVPDSMTLEEAATIPVVYMTAFYALIMRGKMLKGESVLIHAGSGGVGQAAINVALSMECEIFTTVGTKEKREFIKNTFPSIKDDHIFDSRSISFSDDVLIATNGRGVDLILNSLSEEKLQAGLDCLAKGGRFLEIGKYDFMVNSLMDPVKLYGNKTFESVCVAFFMTKIQDYKKEGMHPELEKLRSLINDGLKKGIVKPLSRHVFEWNQAEESFRFMANGKHIGKVLIRMRNEESVSETQITGSRVRVSFDPSKSYIVIGGLGGMGLEMCYWLVTKGVRNLIITSRTGVRTSYHRFCIDRMESFGSNVLVLAKDVSELGQAKELIDFAATLGPVGGIFNLAMVLKDAAFEDQTVEFFEECCNIKVRGTFNLDQITRAICPSLDHFVCFSSLAATVGNTGQSNYGLANAFMDNLCMKRKEDGFPGLSFAWGAIGDVGHVAENMGNDVIVIASVPQRINSCLDVVERHLYSDNFYIGSAVPVDRTNFEVKGDIVATILNVLGIKDHSKVDPKSTLGELGLDSLMAVEIKQVLEKKFDKVLTTKEIRESTIEGLRELQAEHESKTGSKVDPTKLDKTLKTYEFDADLILPEKTFVHLANVDSSEISPIFLIPAFEGSFNNLKSLTEKLSKITKRPLIGLNWVKGVDSYECVKDVSAYYIEQLVKLYLNLESFDLIAYSFGTLIAIEMAYLFQNIATQKIGKLILLDFSPKIGKPYLTVDRVKEGSTPNFVDIAASYFSRNMASGNFDLDEKITEIPDEPTLKKYLNIFQESTGNKYTNTDYLEAFDRVRKKIKMVRDYEPVKILNHDVKLIRATKVSLTGVDLNLDTDYGLSTIVCGKVDVVKFDGDHYSFINLNAETIANEIVEYISQ